MISSGLQAPREFCAHCVLNSRRAGLTRGASSACHVKITEQRSLFFAGAERNQQSSAAPRIKERASVRIRSNTFRALRVCTNAGRRPLTHRTAALMSTVTLLDTPSNSVTRWSARANPDSMSDGIRTTTPMTFSGAQCCNSRDRRPTALSIPAGNPTIPGKSPVRVRLRHAVISTTILC